MWIKYKNNEIINMDNNVSFDPKLQIQKSNDTPLIKFRTRGDYFYWNIDKEDEAKKVLEWIIYHLSNQTEGLIDIEHEMNNYEIKFDTLESNIKHSMKKLKKEQTK